MRILSTSVKNFGSYKELSLDFTDRGLTLISGPTGSGKSTLCDIVPWVLFGRSAKGGAVDEVISWNANSTTEGSVKLIINDKFYEIIRERGSKPGENDLCWSEGGDYPEEVYRGKDLNDTQKLINGLLGMTAETYLSGAYFHEFSQAAQFFTTTAKNRRVITEQLADLTLAKTIQENAALYNKELKKEHEELESKLILARHTNSSLHKAITNDKTRVIAWNKQQEIDILTLENKMLNYEQIKAESIKELTYKWQAFESDKQDKITTIEDDIKDLTKQLRTEAYFKEQEAEFKRREAALGDSKCKECGAPKEHSAKLVMTKEYYNFEKEKNNQYNINQEIRKLTQRLEQIKLSINPHAAQVAQENDRPNFYIERLEEAKKQINPFEAGLETLMKSYTNAQEKLFSLEADFLTSSIDLADMNLLLDVINDFRGSIIEHTVDFLAKSTNEYLETHFDAEIRITLEVKDADKLEVNITKDGNIASYTQLSKGQRQMLNLCLGTSVMKAISNHNGANFNCLFFDEVLSGMDGELKVKAFNLLESLALTTENVFCVEHNDNFKTLFSNVIRVTLVDGASTIENT